MHVNRVWYRIALIMILVAGTISVVSAGDFENAQNTALQAIADLNGKVPLNESFTDQQLSTWGFTPTRPGGYRVYLKNASYDAGNGTLVLYMNAWNNGTSLHIHNPVRWYMPFIDNETNGATRYQNFVTLVVSYLDNVPYGEPENDDSLVIYPSIDGYVEETTSAAYATIRADVGDSAGSGSTTTVLAPRLDSPATGSGNYHIFDRGVLSFNTSSLPDDATISSANFTVYVTAQATELGTPAYGITGGVLASNTSLAAGDFDGWQNVRYASDKSISTSARNNWSLNTAGMANISKTSFTVIYLRDSWDINASMTGTWVKNSVSSITWRPVGYGTVSQRPYLEVIFTAVPYASFTSNVTSGYAPLSVQFNDTSNWTPTSWAWDANNVTGNNTWFRFNSTTQNATTVFGVGNWSIRLNASNAYGTNTSTQVTFVNVTPPPPIASFTANVTSGITPTSVQFNDTSTNSPTSWNWSANNVTGNNTWFEFSTVQNATTVFGVGNWSIRLNATNSGGTNTSTQVTFVNVTLPPATVAAFSVNKNRGSSPLTVTFTDRSTNTPTSWFWVFGDGSTENNTQQNPVHTFTSNNNSVYSVNLTATNGGDNLTSPVVEIRVSAVGSGGNAWEEKATQLNSQTIIYSLVTYDEGSGNAIYGGTYNASIFARLFKYNTSLGNWTQVADQLNSQTNIYSLVTYDDGSGNAIYGGTSAGGRLFKYNTSLGNWTQVANQLNSQSMIHSLVTYDDGSGNAIYGGTGNSLGQLFKYNGTTGGWVQVADQLNSQSNIHSLVTYDDGSGNAIYGGTSTGGKLFKYNVSLGGWSEVANQLNNETIIFSLVTYDDGSGNAIYGGTGYNGTLYKYNVSLGGWVMVASSLNTQTYTRSLVTYDDGSGNAIYGGMGLNGKLFKYNGTTGGWVQIADQLNSQVMIYSLVTYDDGSGNAIYGGTGNGGRLFKVVYPTTIPVASFTSNVTSGTAPTSVQFNDTSTNTPTAWNWSANNVTGNNTWFQFSTSQNATTVFGVGNWSIRLNATNGGGTNTSTQVTYINVSSGVTTPVASFTSNVTSGAAPTSVQFNDTSTNTPTSWNWSANNVTGNNTWFEFSTVQNATVVFGIGNWSIRLNATNAGGTNTSTQVTYVNVSQTIPDPVANFTSNVTSGAVPLSVAFTDTSTGSPTSWAWFFGDEPYNQSWVQQSANATVGWGVRRNHGMVALSDGSVIIMGGWADWWGARNDTWRSTDKGVTWQKQDTSINRSLFQIVALPDDSIIFMGGSTAIPSLAFNDTWRSTDKGDTWTLINASSGWAIRQGLSSVVMPDESIILVGGNNVSADIYYNDTWRSTDGGLTWVQQSASAGWSARRTMTLVKINNTIVLMGGSSKTTGVSNDTWQSTNNGVTWTLVNASSGWAARHGHTSVAMPDDSIVLMGGWNESSTIMYNDTWRSTDKGVTWTRINVSPGWSARRGFTSVVIPDGSILLSGGSTGSASNNNDTWRFNPVGSSSQNPTHIYTTAGTYNVSLTVNTTSAYNTTIKTTYINVSSEVTPPVASFTSNVTSGTAPTSVQFNDTSTNTPTSWNWSANNVTGNNTWFEFSTVQNATVVFGIGNWSIRLNATNAGGTNTSTQVTYINISSGAVAPVASFTVDKTTIRISNRITATDTSTNTPTSWQWSWGDGSANSTVQNPVHLYQKRGNYNIILTATNGGGSGTSSATAVRVLGFQND